MLNFIQKKKNEEIKINIGDEIKVTLHNGKIFAGTVIGVIISYKNNMQFKEFRVRKIENSVGGRVGIERTFNFDDDEFEEIEIVKKGEKRVAKNYYLKDNICSDKSIKNKPARCYKKREK